MPVTVLSTLHGLKWSESRSVMSNSLWPQVLYSPWNSLGQNTGVGSCSLLQLANPGIKPKSPVLQVDSLLSESPGKPKNTGVGSLSLLQQIFPTQESNWGLLHCRRILYQLSYQGSPFCILNGLISFNFHNRYEISTNIILILPLKKQGHMEVT